MIDNYGTTCQDMQFVTYPGMSGQSADCSAHRNLTLVPISQPTTELCSPFEKEGFRFLCEGPPQNRPVIMSNNNGEVASMNLLKTEYKFVSTEVDRFESYRDCHLTETAIQWILNKNEKGRPSYGKNHGLGNPSLHRIVGMGAQTGNPAVPTWGLFMTSALLRFKLKKRDSPLVLWL
jgi:hypothetical protein